MKREDLQYAQALVMTVEDNAEEDFKEEEAKVIANEPPVCLLVF